MELFTVFVKSESEESFDRLLAYFKEEFAYLHSATGEAECMLEFDTDNDVRKIECRTQQFRLIENGPPVLSKAASAMAEYIVSEYEPRLLRAIVRKQFHYELPEEIEALVRYCTNILNGDPNSADFDGTDEEMARHDRERRKGKIVNEIEAFLSVNNTINLDGFVTFRLSSYWDELREIAAYAVDEYIMDKQYQEFISLLKYFVRVQEIKLPIVHVLHKGGSEFALYDEQYTLLESAPADRIVAEMLESEMNMEDMIVSTLITVSPQQIVIHTRQPDLPVMRTLETIFEQRVTLCAACPNCNDYFSKKKQPAADCNLGKKSRRMHT